VDGTIYQNIGALVPGAPHGTDAPESNVTSTRGPSGIAWPLSKVCAVTSTFLHSVLKSSPIYLLFLIAV